MLNVGIIGAGRIGKVHCESIMRYVKSATVKAIADPFLNDETKEWAKGLGVNEFHTDYHKILEDKDIQAVLICSSTDTHSTISLEAIAAGKHIFCEKPIDHDVNKILEVKKALENSNVKYQVGFNRRFDHNFKAARKAVEGGQIGDLNILKVCSRDPGAPPVSYIKVSGGIFLDMTIHDFDMVRFMSGSEVEEVFAYGAVLVDPAIGEAGDIDTAVISMKLTAQSQLLITAAVQATATTRELRLSAHSVRLLFQMILSQQQLFQTLTAFTVRFRSTSSLRDTWEHMLRRFLSSLTVLLTTSRSLSALSAASSPYLSVLPPRSLLRQVCRLKLPMLPKNTVFNN